MPNIIRIRDLEIETDLNDIIIPVDKNSYHSLAKKITGEDLKSWVLSDICTNIISNTIEMNIVGDPCAFLGYNIDCPCSYAGYSIVCVV
jgi:hypothetical protein